MIKLMGEKKQTLRNWLDAVHTAPLLPKSDSEGSVQNPMPNGRPVH
jgi:hypothetical protein